MVRVAPEGKKEQRTRRASHGVLSLVRQFLDSRLFSILSALVTFFALFGDDVRLATWRKPDDEPYYYAVSVALGVFSLELIANCLVRPRFLCPPSFFFWLDLVATLSLIPDIPWLWEPIAQAMGADTSTFGADTVDVRAGRAARIGTRAARALRILRYIRLLRIFKIYKLFVFDNREDKVTTTDTGENATHQDRKPAEEIVRQPFVSGAIPVEEEEGSMDENASGTWYGEGKGVKSVYELEEVLSSHSRGLRGGKSSHGDTMVQLMEKEENKALQRRPDEETVSHLGLVLSDMSIRRVILLILAMLFVVPFLELTEDVEAMVRIGLVQNAHSLAQAPNATRSDIRAEVELTARFAGRLIYFSVCSQASIDSIGELSTPQNQSGCIYHAPASRTREWLEDLKFGSEGFGEHPSSVSASSTSSQKIHPITGWSSNLVLDDEEDIVHLYRPIEVAIISAGGCDDGGSGGKVCVSRAYFDLRHITVDAARLSILRTAFVLFLLLVGAFLLTQDVTVLVLRPIERMTRLVRRLADDPLKALAKMKRAAVRRAEKAARLTSATNTTAASVTMYDSDCDSESSDFEEMLGDRVGESGVGDVGEEYTSASIEGEGSREDRESGGDDGAGVGKLSHAGVTGARRPAPMLGSLRTGVAEKTLRGLHVVQATPAKPPSTTTSSASLPRSDTSFSMAENLSMWAHDICEPCMTPASLHCASEYLIQSAEELIGGSVYRRRHEAAFETRMIEDAMFKIGGLLQVGFGEAGGEIIAENIRRAGGRLDPIVKGTKVDAVFGFCDIRKFTTVTECLEEDVLVFVNCVASIVHSAVHRFGGAANKNVGDAFLLTWKLPIIRDAAAVIEARRRLLKQTTTFHVPDVSVKSSSSRQGGSRAGDGEARGGEAGGGGAGRGGEGEFPSIHSKRTSSPPLLHAEVKPPSYGKKDVEDGDGEGERRDVKESDPGSARDASSSTASSAGTSKEGHHDPHGFHEDHDDHDGKREPKVKRKSPPRVRQRRNSQVQMSGDAFREHEAGLAFGRKRALVANIADSALAAFLKIIIDLRHSSLRGSLSRFRKDARLLRRFPDGFECRMGLGMHLGWAVEGTIGSSYKVDASYLAPAVNLSARLEAATKQYDVPILISSSFAQELSIPAQSYLRLVDRVILKGTGKPIELYTFDIQTYPSSFGVLPWNVRPRNDEDREYNRTAHECRIHVDFDSDPNVAVLQEGLSQEFFSTFEDGLCSYFDGNWDDARENLSAASELRPGGDGPSKTLLSFMGDRQAPEDWAGYRALTEK